MANPTVPIIGKDVIESLTIGMYEDSKFIYREYIQNSADQIDRAIQQGLLLAGEGEIHISINTEEQTIIIEDDATGISKDKVVTILRDIAQSTKTRGVDKGFRGIGRLGGLGYCAKLIFETSFVGENVKSIMTWDAALLKKIINNRSQKEEAAKVINEVTSYKTAPEEESAHYFKVIMTGITNADLLDVREIRNYLSMVAPVPFENHFIFRSKIYSELNKEKLVIDEYKIFINSEQIFKGYSSIIYEGEDGNKRKVDELFDIVFFKEVHNQSHLLYWGWYGLSTFQNKQLNSINKARGLRLRKSNIQIGNEYTLVKLHREQRSNFYFLGEVHAFHNDLIPNSRRDYFIENDSCFILEQKLKSFFHTQLHRLYYTASEINSAIKRIEELGEFKKEIEIKQKDGFTDKDEHKEYLEKLEKKKEEAEKAQNKIQRLKESYTGIGFAPIQSIIDKVTSGKKNKTDAFAVFESKPTYRTDRLTSLTKEQRKFLSKIFSIIRNVLSKDTAEELIRKIEEELK
jgi:hypothetical protein